MLRILEAMGIMALLTQETPQQIAAERVLFKELLEATLSKIENARISTQGYINSLEKRVPNLPSELQAGLDPGRIAKLLGESLHQNFIQIGLPNTTRALHATVDELIQVQKGLSDALHRIAHPNDGIIVQVRQVNDALSHTLETRARKVDALLFHLTRHLVRVWMPIVATTAFAFGCIVGITVESKHSTLPATQIMVQPQVPAMPPSSPPPSKARKAHKQHESRKTFGLNCYPTGRTLAVVSQNGEIAMPRTSSLANPEKRRIRGSRLGFRVDAQTKKLVERAAALERRSLTDFCLTVLTQATQATITRHESIVLSERDRKAFFDALVHSPKPNARLRRAFRSAQERIVS